jgi:hypothetical protein
MRSAIIWFPTDEFVDSDDERNERINEDIGGAALAKWLSSALRGAGLTAVEPWPEDHGWDFEANVGGATYLLVCTIEDRANDAREACVQVHLGKLRSVPNTPLDRSDAVVAKVAELIEGRGSSIHFE